MALKSGETAPIPQAGRDGLTSTDSYERAHAQLRDRLDQWRQTRTVSVANDVVSSAFVLDLALDVEEVARFILEHETSTTEHAARLAKLVVGETAEATTIGRVFQYPESSPAQAVAAAEGAARQGIRTIRRRVRDMPRNPLAWTDLARHYSTLGLKTQAARAMRIGLALAPEHRFILRSASRLFVHNDDLELAVAVLRRSAAIGSDPWLVASEIAVSRVAARKPLNMRLGRQMLASADYAPAHLAELASAVASVELEHGSDRRARRLFIASLQDPNDNVVAQAEWASRQLPETLVDRHHLELPNAFEARAWEHYLQSSWEAALEQCLQWATDEPFSSRPPVLASFIASCVLEDYERGLSFARLGLRANPLDPVLLNNAAFSLASSGRVGDAEDILRRVDIGSLGDDQRIPWLATAGLIRFRTGRTTDGEELYTAAASLARRMRKPDQEASALIFHARERILSGIRDCGPMLARAGALVSATTAPGLVHVLARTDKMRMRKNL